MRLFEVNTSPDRVGMLGIKDATELRLFRCTIDLDTIVSVSESGDPNICNVHFDGFFGVEWCVISYEDMVKIWKEE